MAVIKLGYLTLVLGRSSPVVLVPLIAYGCPGRNIVYRLGWVVANITLLERRLALVEARLAELESAYGDTLYKLHRRVVMTDLNAVKVLDHLGIATATDDDVDPVLGARRLTLALATQR